MRQYERPPGQKTRTRHYFTTDGCYGDASEMEVFDTTRWTEEDWAKIDQSSDRERVIVAMEIRSRILDEDIRRAFGKA